MAEAWLHGGAAFLLAFIVGTLVEYGVHRLMHGRWVLGKKHAAHHRDGWGQGWLGEFRDYFLPCIPIIWLGLLVSVPLTPLVCLLRLYEAMTSSPRLKSEQVARLAEDKAVEIGPARDDLGFDPRPFAEGIRAEAALSL